MKKFEYDIVIIAPTKEDAIQKLNALNTIGTYLSLSELQALAKTASNPTALAYAKSKLGLR